jgi:FkbM family methyltransferase
MNIFRIIRSIITHPLNKGNKILALWRFLRWQIGIWLLPYGIIYPFIEHTRFIAQKGLTSATGNIYCGLFEYQDMLFLLHFLSEGDLFYDVGANIGTYTILASGVAHATSVAFEPTPSTFEMLRSNITLNNIESNVSLFNMGVGSTSGVVSFVATSDSERNHVAAGSEKNTISVPLTTIDLEAKKYGVPLFIKIDVEGYETNVIQGMEETLQDHHLKVLLVELNGSSVTYGLNENDIHAKILKAGFLPYDYDPVSRSLKELQLHGVHNTLYIRDHAFAAKRIVSARKITVLGKEF